MPLALLSAAVPLRPKTRHRGREACLPAPKARKPSSHLPASYQSQKLLLHLLSEVFEALNSRLVLYKRGRSFGELDLMF